jgi:hypothetical protein
MSNDFDREAALDLMRGITKTAMMAIPTKVTPGMGVGPTKSLEQTARATALANLTPDRPANRMVNKKMPKAGGIKMQAVTPTEAAKNPAKALKIPKPPKQPTLNANISHKIPTLNKGPRVGLTNPTLASPTGDKPKFGSAVIAHYELTKEAQQAPSQMTVQGKNVWPGSPQWKTSPAWHKKKQNKIIAQSKTPFGQTKAKVQGAFGSAMRYVGRNPVVKSIGKEMSYLPPTMGSGVARLGGSVAKNVARIGMGNSGRLAGGAAKTMATQTARKAGGQARLGKLLNVSGGMQRGHPGQQQVANMGPGGFFKPKFNPNLGKARTGAPSLSPARASDTVVSGGAKPYAPAKPGMISRMKSKLPQSKPKQTPTQTPQGGRPGAPQMTNKSAPTQTPVPRRHTGTGTPPKSEASPMNSFFDQVGEQFKRRGIDNDKIQDVINSPDLQTAAKKGVNAWFGGAETAADAVKTPGLARRAAGAFARKPIRNTAKAVVGGTGVALGARTAQNTASGWNPKKSGIRNTFNGVKQTTREVFKAKNELGKAVDEVSNEAAAEGLGVATKGSPQYKRVKKMSVDRSKGKRLPAAQRIKPMNAPTKKLEPIPETAKLWKDN